jgi:hypothetical protein
LQKSNYRRKKHTQSTIVDFPKSANKILNNIKNGLKEVELFKKGKLKTTSAKNFLNEL